MPADSPARGNAAKLERHLRELSASGDWEKGEPLPTTRSLGERFGIANTTAARVLQRLSEEGALWRSDSGRYFLPSSRPLIERPLPIACLTRELARWSTEYRAIMEGVSNQPDNHPQTALLLWRYAELVGHDDVNLPPRFATSEEQKTSLAQFRSQYDDQYSGLILDHIWHDNALAAFPELLRNAVVLCRPTNLPSVGSVVMDVEQAALLALSHLVVRGYDRILAVSPFTGDPPVDAILKRFLECADQLEANAVVSGIHDASTPAARDKLVKQLEKSPGRTALFVPEDNIALTLLRELQRHRMDCPGKIGILSAMGTQPSREAGLSSVAFDFHELGRRAAAMVRARTPQHQTLRASLHALETT